MGREYRHNVANLQILEDYFQVFDLHDHDDSSSRNGYSRQGSLEHWR